MLYLKKCFKYNSDEHYFKYFPTTLWPKRFHTIVKLHSYAVSIKGLDGRRFCRLIIDVESFSEVSLSSTDVSRTFTCV